jgi:hypothetical protein
MKYQLTLLPFVLFLSGCATSFDKSNVVDSSYLTSNELSLEQSFYFAIMGGPDVVIPLDRIFCEKSAIFLALRDEARSRYGDEVVFLNSDVLMLEGYYYMIIVNPRDLTYHYLAIIRGGSVIYVYGLDIDYPNT